MDSFISIFALIGVAIFVIGVLWLLGVIIAKVLFKKSKKKRFIYPIITILVGAVLFGGLGTLYFQSKIFHSLNLIDIQAALSDKELHEVKKKLEAVFNFDVNTYRKEIDISSTYNLSRRQYNAAHMLEKLSLQSSEPKTYNIYIISEDIYGPEYNFLFSHTDFNESITVISLNRFKTSEPRSSNIVSDRLYKLLLRRIGVMLSVPTAGCVMQYSNSLSELDGLDANYCPRDYSFLQRIGVID